MPVGRFVKYDMITGIGVHIAGHSHPALLEAGFEAALQDTIMQGNLQQGPVSADVCRLLLEAANRRGQCMDHCFLTTSGVMANENAMKMLFQRKPGSDRVLAFNGCFMGRTLALGQVTDRAKYRDGMPNTLNVDYIPFFDADRPEESTRRALHVLDRMLTRYPGRHAAMVFELVQGEGGFFPGDHDFFMTLIRRLKEAEVPVLVDEVQTFGRTTEMYAFQYFGLAGVVDVVTVGKMTQVCATLFRDEFTPRPGLISADLHRRHRLSSRRPSRC